MFYILLVNTLKLISIKIIIIIILKLEFRRFNLWKTVRDPVTLVVSLHALMVLCTGTYGNRGSQRKGIENTTRYEPLVSLGQPLPRALDEGRVWSTDVDLFIL